MRIKLTTLPFLLPKATPFAHTLVVSPGLREETHIGDPQCLCVEILAWQEGDPTIEEGARRLAGHPSS